MELRSLIVGSNRGGCGKTSATAGVVDCIAAAGGTAKVVEYEVEARLGAILGRGHPIGGVMTRGDAPTAEEIEADPESARAFYDELITEMREGGRIYDTAANFADRAMDAIGDMGAARILEDGRRVGVAIVTTADADAIRGAMALYVNTREALPEARIFLVECEKEGRIAGAPETYDEIRKDGSVTLIRVPRLEMRDAHSLLKMPLGMLSTVTWDGLMRTEGLTYPEALRAEVRLRRFAETVQEALLPLVRWYCGEDVEARGGG